MRFQNSGEGLAGADGQILTAAARARQTIRADGLCVPFKGPTALSAASVFVTVCYWGVFNPFGPSIVGVALLSIPDPDRLEWLLITSLRHPFYPSIEVRGILPFEAAQRSSTMFDALCPLFARNGSPDFPMLITLPTHVRTLPDSPLAMPHLRELFFVATPHVSEPDIESTCRRIEKWSDPVQRAFAETSDSLERRASSEGKEPIARRISRAGFNRWWRLVTAPDHVARELREVEFAWQKALEVFGQ